MVLVRALAAAAVSMVVVSRASCGARVYRYPHRLLEPHLLPYPLLLDASILLEVVYDILDDISPRMEPVG